VQYLLGWQFEKSSHPTISPGMTILKILSPYCAISPEMTIFKKFLPFCAISPEMAI